jgi:DNA-directed RNA polymerase sigma subunit (sigma70/sigma32)
MKQYPQNERAARWEAGLSNLEALSRAETTEGRPAPSFTAAQIAEACGVSRQAVDMIMKKALAKLKKPASQIRRELIA